MKEIAFILSFIILGLSCLPCTDGKYAGVKDVSKTVVISSQINGYEPHSDFCNPFCSCSCCGVQLSSTKIISLSTAIAGYNLTHTDSYFCSPLAPLPAVIWQPPQLV